MRTLRPAILVLLLAGLVAPGAAAQSSQFGVRGLGLPSFPFSVRTQGSAGMGGFFDPASAVNPASVAGVRRPTASFNLIQHWRTTDNPYGTASGNDTQFPLFIAGGPISGQLAAAVSASVYADRTFGLAFRDTVDLRGIPTAVDDTLESKGGITDLRFSAAWRNEHLVVGLGFHVLTGTNRLAYRRAFADSSYARVNLRNELSYAGVGVSGGIVIQPNEHLLVGGFARLDGDISMELDSLKLEKLPLPVTMGAAFQWYPSRRFTAGAHVIRQSWSRLDTELVARGGSGAANTTTLAGGIELASSTVHPDRFPLRLGVRSSSLPFPVETGADPGREFGITFGTGFVFSGGRGSLDLGLERVWRTQDAGFEERGFALKLGVTVRQ